MAIIWKTGKPRHVQFRAAVTWLQGDNQDDNGAGGRQGVTEGGRSPSGVTACRCGFPPLPAPHLMSVAVRTPFCKTRSDEVSRMPSFARLHKSSIMKSGSSVSAQGRSECLPMGPTVQALTRRRAERFGGGQA